MRALRAEHPQRAPGGSGAPWRAVRSSGFASSGVRSRASYGLDGPFAGARVAAQPPQHAPVVPEGVVALRRFDNLNHRRQPRVAHHSPERLRAYGPLADPLVPIEPRSPGPLGIVEMQALEEREANLLLELLPYLVQGAGHVIPHSMQVGGVEAEAHAGPGWDRHRLAQRAELLEGRSERCAGPGR